MPNTLFFRMDQLLCAIEKMLDIAKTAVPQKGVPAANRFVFSMVHSDDQIATIDMSYPDIDNLHKQMVWCEAIVDGHPCVTYFLPSSDRTRQSTRKFIAAYSEQMPEILAFKNPEIIAVSRLLDLITEIEKEKTKADDTNNN